MHSCDHCGKTFTRKTSLTRHKEGHCKYGQPLPSYDVKTSQSTSKWLVTGTPPRGQKRSRSPNFDGSDKETGPRNPKITTLVNIIINDNSPTQDQSEPPENQLAATDVFQSPAQIPRAKGDIIGYSDDEVSSTKVKYLPAIVDGLLKRFNKLYKKFTQGRHEHGNELVALLDELLREEYTQRNNVIAKSLDAATDDDDADTMHADAAAAADDDEDDDANDDDDTAEYVIPETD